MPGKKGGNANQPQDFKFDFNSAELIKGIQGKLGELVGSSSGYLESLPESVQNRITVLKGYHNTKTVLDAEYQKELRALENKYRALFEPLYDKRLAVISGTVEPTAEEIAAAKASGIKKEGEAEKPAAVKKEGEKKEADDVKGVPDFWLTVLQHSMEFGEQITDRDAEALHFLKDVRSRRLEDSPVSFAIDFFFEPNPFFDNDVLTKTYHLIEKEVGPTMYDKAEGTPIKWKAGKNLTVRKVTKQQGGKRGRGGRRGGAAPKPVTVEEKCESFFHFFDPEGLIDDDEFEDEELEAILEDDYEVGISLKEEIIPNAILWFTGENPIDDYMMMGDEDDDDDEDGESGSDDDHPPQRGGNRGSVPALEDVASDEDPDFVPDPNAPAQNPQNCNQQ